MRKICVVTGTRAEYGLLSRLMRLIDESEDCQLQVVATNMHLLPEYGNTYREIEQDGFCITARVPMKKPTDDPPRRYDTATDNECNQGITFTFLGRPDDHKKHGDKQQAGIDHRV